MPNYLVSTSDDAVVLRNYEGMLIRYQAEDKPQTIQPTATRGVSGLLQGDKTVLMPEDNERMARRKPRVVRDGCGGGCGRVKPVWMAIHSAQSCRCRCSTRAGTAASRMDSDDGGVETRGAFAPRCYWQPGPDP